MQQMNMEKKPTKSVHLDDAIHTEMKAYAHFRGLLLYKAVGLLLRKALDTIEKESENGENANLDVGNN